METDEQNKLLDSIKFLAEHYRDQSEFQAKEANKHFSELVRTLMYISTGGVALIFGVLYSDVVINGKWFFVTSIFLLLAVFFGGLQMWLDHIAFKNAKKKSSNIADRAFTYTHSIAHADGDRQKQLRADMSETFEMAVRYNKEVKDSKGWPMFCQVVCLSFSVIILLVVAAISIQRPASHERYDGYRPNDFRNPAHSL